MLAMALQPGRMCREEWSSLLPRRQRSPFSPEQCHRGCCARLAQALRHTLQTPQAPGLSAATIECHSLQQGQHAACRMLVCRRELASLAPQGSRWSPVFLLRLRLTPGLNAQRPLISRKLKVCPLCASMR